MHPEVFKLLARSKKTKGKRTVKIHAKQSTEHRLVYLNPMERARRDLENRHGDNVKKMAQASAERLTSTLEAQMMNLGVSQGR